MYSIATIAIAVSSLISAVGAIPVGKTCGETRGTSVDLVASAGIAPALNKYWFSFGDSYTQTGFDIAGDKPTFNNPMGNPPYPGETACGSNVANWIDFVTFEYNTTKVLTYNFARGGATIDANLVKPDWPQIESLTDQVNIFLSNVGPKPAYAPWTAADSMFSFFIGINDIGNSYYLPGDRGAFADVLLNAYFALVQKIYDVGGRNFLFFTVPPVDRSPLVLSRNATTRALEKSVIDTFNKKLIAKAQDFGLAHFLDANTWVYDANARLVQVLDNPTAFGFKDATSYGSDNDEVWCGNYHISPNMEKIYAQDVANLVKPLFF
ncbi:carbohydrate esterase family 16 protein [Botryobasidium botryosum FD-172 SS1]|uniref:Carbohydrate esterase family 16 protein n=1 Tax=Botryobasidium botryosum (strain FD-172 SS1) TaxID=930990 RepID=A0A067MBU8_BOTB1|nr:carbohydrate esterase family 16 protein [Botryobasidium botryosum FD-172 SS1]